MPRTRLAIVSDLHCRLDSEPDDSYLTVGAPRNPSNRHPVQALLDLIQADGLSVDTLLVPGDLTNRASIAGLSDGWNHALEIGSRLHAQAIIPVIGNHDIDSRRVDPVVPIFDNVRNLRPGFPFATDAENQSYFSDGYCLIDTPNAQILALNTVIDHTDEASAKRGTFSTIRIERMEQSLRDRLTAPLRVALLHHHPILHTGPYLTDSDVIPNGDVLLEALGRLGCRLVVHGHKHLTRLSYVNNVAVFASGSFAAKLIQFAPTSMRNTFHIIELDGEAPESVRGRVYTWTYFYNSGWQRSESTYTGFPFQTGFGRTATLQSIADSLISLSTSDASASRFRETQVLATAPDTPFLTPQERVSLDALLKQRDLELTDRNKGQLELWKEFTP